jgi:hypothetical protein
MSADTADSLWMVIRCCGNPYGDENQINEHIICQKTLLSTVHWLHISDLCMQNKTHKTLNRHSAFAAKMRQMRAEASLMRQAFVSRRRRRKAFQSWNDSSVNQGDSSGLKTKKLTGNEAQKVKRPHEGLISQM